MARDLSYIKNIALGAVADRRAHQQNANAHFFESVKDAKAAGCSLREIAEAAGYSSNSPVQHILRKWSQS